MSGPRVRFAPSPTGDLHVGGVRTALYNWLEARAKGGSYLLRIEDTDRERSKPEHTQAILEGLGWLGLDPDEDTQFQSDRAALHREKVRHLLEIGGAYRCYCTREELAAMRAEAQEQKRAFRYPRTWRDRTEPPEEGAPYAVRAKLPLDGSVVFDDLVKGRIEIRNDQLEDFVIARADGSAVYNLVVVVDDIDMGITHVIRGDDHINNTPKQIHLYDLFGAERPAFAHLPMVHGPDGKKLSKRHGASSILAFRELGYLPETMISFLARLGWSHGDQEEFTREELVRWFSIEDCGASAGIFDHKKLDWQNGRRIRELAPEALIERARPFLEREGLDPTVDWLPQAVVLVQERARTLVEVADGLKLFYDRGPVTYEEKAERKFLKPEQRERVAALGEVYAALPEWTSEALETATLAWLAERELRMKHVGQPLRAALTGGTVSPPLFDMLAVLGPDVCLPRLRAVAE